MFYYNHSMLNAALEDNNSGIAVLCYRDAKLRPKTATEARLAAKGVMLDKITKTAHSSVSYGYRDSAPLIIKKVIDLDEIERLNTYLKQALSHPHIISTEMIDREDGATLYAMPRMPVTAQALVKPISDAACIKLVIDILSATKFLHLHGFAHMDIKSDNLGLDTAGNFLLLDLGSVAVFGQYTDVTEAYIPTDIAIAHGRVRSVATVDFWGLAITLIRLRGGSQTRYSQRQVREALVGIAMLGLNGLADLVSLLPSDDKSV